MKYTVIISGANPQTIIAANANKFSFMLRPVLQLKPLFKSDSDSSVRVKYPSIINFNVEFQNRF